MLDNDEVLKIAYGLLKEEENFKFVYIDLEPEVVHHEMNSIGYVFN